MLGKDLLVILRKLAGYSVYGRGRGEGEGLSGRPYWEGGILGISLSLVGYEVDHIVERT